MAAGAAREGHAAAWWQCGDSPATARSGGVVAVERAWRGHGSEQAGWRRPGCTHKGAVLQRLGEVRRGSAAAAESKEVWQCSTA